MNFEYNTVVVQASDAFVNPPVLYQLYDSVEQAVKSFASSDRVEDWSVVDVEYLQVHLLESSRDFFAPAVDDGTTPSRCSLHLRRRRRPQLFWGGPFDKD